MTTMNLPIVVKRKTLEVSNNVLEGSAIDEARNLIHRCAEPRPPADTVKVAVTRVARRLNFTYSRTRELWYGNARRIDAQEMDALRAGACVADINTGVASLKALRTRVSKVPSPAARQVLDGIDAVLGVLGGIDQSASAVEET